MKTRIGYFIPEFPGQTHIFFWREMQALRALDVQPEVVSTRTPDPRIVSHRWAPEAKKETEYLFPPTPPSVFGALVEFLRAGPRGWARCLTAIAQGEGSILKKLRLLPMLFMGCELAWVARRKGWSHVHVHSCGNAAIIAMFAALLGAITYSLTLHGPLEDYGPNQKLKWRHAVFALVITRKLRREVDEQLAGALPPLIEIAPMGVDLEKFHRQTSYQPWEGTGPCRIFSCGRLNPCKAHDDLIRAVGRLRQQGIDAELHIAGEDDSKTGEHRKALEELIAELKLTGKAVLLGAVPEEKVRAELEAAHMFALASLHEPLGVVIMEAMAIEAPVVVTGAGGVAELVDDGVDGLLVEPRQPEQLAEAMLKLCRQPDLARQFSVAGRRKIQAAFHSGVSAETMRRCLEKSGVAGSEGVANRAIPRHEPVS